jgi:hypothetical protein
MGKEKQVTIVVAASGDSKDVMLSPGATVREVLEESSLPGYQLSRKGGEPFAPNTDLSEEAADGEKFYATPSNVSVGGGGSTPFFRFLNMLKTDIDFLFNRIKQNFKKRARHCAPPAKQKRVLVLRTRSFKTKIRRARVTIKPRVANSGKAAQVIGTDKDYPYWKENGWVRVRNGYQGYYKTDYGRWKGFVQENYKSNYSFFIVDPPEKVMKSTHGPCFFDLGDEIHTVHFNEAPKDLSSGIVIVEKTISQAFSGKGE